MAVVYAIQILDAYPDFDINWPVVMWDEGAGPVEVYFPAGQSFTVYKWGTGVMIAAAETRRAHRIVCLSTELFSSTNSDNAELRLQTIGFQARDTGYEQFYNFDQGVFDFASYSERGPDAPQLTRNTSSGVRNPIQTFPGQIIDLFIQAWN